MKRLKGLQRCDECASRKGCLIYTPGKVMIDCNGFVKEPRKRSSSTHKRKSNVAVATK